MLHVFCRNLVKVVETLFCQVNFHVQDENYFSFPKQDDIFFLLHVLISQALQSIFLFFILNCANGVQGL